MLKSLNEALVTRLHGPSTPNVCPLFFLLSRFRGKMTTRKLSAVTRRKSLRLSTTITSAIRSRFPSTHIARFSSCFETNPLQSATVECDGWRNEDGTMAGFFLNTLRFEKNEVSPFFVFTNYKAFKPIETHLVQVSMEGREDDATSTFSGNSKNVGNSFVFTKVGRLLQNTLACFRSHSKRRTTSSRATSSLRLDGSLFSSYSLDHERVQRGREGSPQRLHQGEE